MTCHRHPGGVGHAQDPKRYLQEGQVFARKLNELSDAELDGGTRLPGWTRRHVVAHVDAADPTIITGPLPAVVQWAAGRGW